MTRLDYLEDLNPAQRAAVEYNDGPALVLAGAGSGKTRVLVYKLLHLIRIGYKPGRLVALTFTNKAAREMRERMYQLIGLQAGAIRMGTFHSIFSSILRHHADLLGYTHHFSIYNSNDSKSKIKYIIKSLGLDEKYYKPNLILGKISRAKNQLLSVDQYASNGEIREKDSRANIPRVAEIYARYTHELKLANAMDFDDLLMQINILFRDHPEVLKYWQEQIDYLLIDEYQDTNFAQYMIARQLMKHKGKIFVVGDDAQSIYSFRGANLKNILNFEASFRGTKLFKLEQNYRSSQTIVKVANKLIAHNEEQIHKDIFSLGDVGEPITVYEAFSGEAEASWVAHSIRNICGSNRAKYADCAVLYRTNQQSRILEQKLRGLNIPFRIWGGHSFFNHKEIMDVIAYFKLMTNPLDDEAILRVINYPRRGIGDTTIAKLRQQANIHQVNLAQVIEDPDTYASGLNKGTVSKLKNFANLLGRMREQCQREESFYDLAVWLINTSGIPAELMLDHSSEGEGRRANIQELLVSLEEYERHTTEQDKVASLSAYLAEISLLTDQDLEGGNEQAQVTLMTIHSSKGLEFPHVFIVGLEEQLFPSAMCVLPSELEEERRLLYVAITRAEATCHISYARERFRNGRTEPSRPSRFLRELPPQLIRLKQEGAGDYPYYNTHKQGYDTRVEYGILPKQFVRSGLERNEYIPQGKKRKFIGTRELDSENPPSIHQSAGGFSVGTRVEHPRFGAGEILVLEGDIDDLKATVRFDNGDEKKLLIKFANLKALS